MLLNPCYKEKLLLDIHNAESFIWACSLGLVNALLQYRTSSYNFLLLIEEEFASYSTMDFIVL